MSWIYEHQRNWRIALLVVMVIAFMGPWVFDRINVPAKFECSSPYIRLEGDFCGVPISGIRFIFWNSGGFISIIFGLVTGEFVFSERIREILIIWLLLFPLLPFISTLLLLRRGNNQHMQVFTIIAWVLAIGGGLFLGLNNQPNGWADWGIKLYIGIAFSGLLLETLTLIEERKLIRK